MSTPCQPACCEAAASGQHGPVPEAVALASGRWLLGGWASRTEAAFCCMCVPFWCSVLLHGCRQCNGWCSLCLQQAAVGHVGRVPAGFQLLPGLFFTDAGCRALHGQGMGCRPLKASPYLARPLQGKGASDYMPGCFQTDAMHGMADFAPVSMSLPAKGPTRLALQVQEAASGISDDSEFPTGSFSRSTQTKKPQKCCDVPHAAAHALRTALQALCVARCWPRNGAWSWSCTNGGTCCWHSPLPSSLCWACCARAGQQRKTCEASGGSAQGSR